MASEPPSPPRTLETPDRGLRLVTGATGLLGGHIAERLVQRGERVRAFVRPSSDTRFLETLGVEFVTGDLTDPAACERAVEGVSTVFHAAAKVGDWGPWSEFQAACLDATERLARAALAQGVSRFVHISSTSAYGHPPAKSSPIDERHPLGVRLWRFWDYYTISKVEAERILWRLRDEEGLPLTIIRPSWLYGERDRTTMGRLIERVRGTGIPIIGRGDNPLSAIYAGNVADAAILAADHPEALGEAFNVTDQGPMTQAEFLRDLAEICQAPRPAWYRRLPHPYPVVFAGAFVLEAWGRLTRRPKPPLLTRYATWLMARRTAYDSSKIRKRLGWKPALGNRESLERTIRWFLEREREPGSAIGASQTDPPSVIRS